MRRRRSLLIYILGLQSMLCSLQAQQLATIEVTETAGLSRTQEYVTALLQLSEMPCGLEENWFVYDLEGEEIRVQLYDAKAINDSLWQLSLIFPIDVDAQEHKKLNLFCRSEAKKWVTPLLQVQGEDTELVVENDVYRADLTLSEKQPNKSHESGQLRELTFKEFELMLLRSFNRMHWAPNFQSAESKGYLTIAHWEKPSLNQIEQGAYLVKTQRQDSAPGHPDIQLSATYHFYAGKPYFRFYSELLFEKDIRMFLLRNDEMTMDSLFTHVAFQRPSGQIERYTFAERQQVLDTLPIEPNAPWLCFYHAEKGYAYGSIRLLYDNTNSLGGASPTYLPHTKISNGGKGGKYWNRRLIHKRDTFVPEGSRYREENAYLLFRLDPMNPLEPMLYHAERLRSPLQVRVVH